MTGSYLRRNSPAEDEPEAPPGDNHDGSIKEQDRFLPIANVGRIMKRSLPTNAKISKDAKQTVQECVSEFISFITGEASDKCQKEKRKTINGDDLLWSMSTLGFENYIQPLELYLHRYRELEGIPLPKQGDQSPPSRGTTVRSVAEGTHNNHYTNNNNNHIPTHRSNMGSRLNGSFYSGIPRVCGADDGTGPWRR